MDPTYLAGIELITDIHPPCYSIVYVPLVEQKLLTLPEHLSFTLAF
jgi:hypothetical protein